MNNLAEQITPTSIKLQPASLDIWDKKYRLRDSQGDAVEHTPSETFERIAQALADIECKDNTATNAKFYDEFLWALNNGALPAGRIISNAGAEQYRPSTSTINCTVSGAIDDSMGAILTNVEKAGMTLKAGCGIGYEFSTIRPSGAYVSGAGATTSGPLSFMSIYDKMCFIISSAGGRRGAQMATFDVSHPDVRKFITAKRTDGELRQFNLSLLITNDFIAAVRAKADWNLVFPTTMKELERQGISLDDSRVVLKNNWLDVDFIERHDYMLNDDNELLCLSYGTIPAARLWDIIMASNYDFAEPGFLLIDEINRMNNNWYCENIRATNPCGEQPLPPNAACLLGSINLTMFVINPFTPQAYFDFDKFNKVVAIFTRMLDNVVEINRLPLAAQREEIESKRRHGMGYLGLGSALSMLQMPYGQKDSVEFTEKVTKAMALTGWKVALELSKEKGAAPALLKEYEITRTMMAQHPEMADDGIKVGDKVKGAVLHSKYSHYMKRIAQEDPELVEALVEHGARFTHHTSIAPTGTLALSLGNNVSNGIEPSFSHAYNRNIIREGKKSKELVEVASYELLMYRALINDLADPLKASDDANGLPEYMSTTDSVTPNQHVDIQAAAQKWVDSSISKTINVPTDIDYEDFKNIYLYAYDKGLKGCTTFRFNPENFQGVLVKTSDLENTIYNFTLDDGSVATFKGNEMITYDGEEHTAANLYDAIKEGYYGKF